MEACYRARRSNLIPMGMSESIIIPSYAGVHYLAVTNKVVATKLARRLMVGSLGGSCKNQNSYTNLGPLKMKFLSKIYRAEGPNERHSKPKGSAKHLNLQKSPRRNLSMFPWQPTSRIDSSKIGAIQLWQFLTKRNCSTTPKRISRLFTCFMCITVLNILRHDIMILSFETTCHTLDEQFHQQNVFQ